MSEVAKINISNLLSQVSIIKNKYDDIAEYTGENYNIFNVLGVYQDELSHSAIIGDLLNAKGKHGQKDTFLRLFLKELPSFENNSSQFKVIETFKTANSRVFIEKHIGKVNYENGEGGRIDILINDGKNNIIIENKVWAGDQYLQLVRYNNQDKNAPILYLTLEGKEPKTSSRDNLKLGETFICISYKDTIKKWLENCIKEMTNKPIIRESLNQYLVLVKQLTNQSTNNKMKEEIINLLIKSPENLKAAKAISDNYKIGMKLINLEVFYRLFSCLNELGFDTENSFLEKDERIDTAFIPLKEFILEDGIFELGINIELENNYFFFCVLRKNELRKPNVNTLPKFQEIRDFLHSRVKNLNVVNGWTIGKSNEFTIGLDINDYTEENELNIEALKKLAEKINNFKTLLNS